MSIKYCDFTNGVDYDALSAWVVSTAYSVNDMVKDGTAAYKCISGHTSTADDEPGVGANWETYWSLEGDGSTSNPYKTITDASIGLAGGDEVRVAKSPADTALTGTLDFTLHGTAVNGSGTAFTTELAIGDFVKGGDGQYYEIVVITDDTHATLYKAYPSATESGVTGYKLGVTSTGEAAEDTTVVQEVSTSGSSITSRLKISGGWDLSGPTQDGQSYFRQMHSTFANRYGYGLYLPTISYVEIERCHFLRYNYGIRLYTQSTNNLLTSLNCLSNIRGIYLYSNSNNNEITSPVCNANNWGLYIYDSSNNKVTNPICNSQTGDYHYGLYIRENSNNNIITSPTCNHNNYGVYFYYSSDNYITNLVANNNTYGIVCSGSSKNIINKYTYTGNSSNSGYYYNKHFGEYPYLKVMHYGYVDNNRCFFENGTTYKDTANARSTQCLGYIPTSAVYYISQSFFFRADSEVAQTLSTYIKKDSDFNGDVQAAIYFMGEKITGWTEWSTTTDYVQKSIAAAAGDITEDGVLELRIKVRGTAGNVYVDDLATS